MVNGLSFALDVLGLRLNVNSWVKKNYENLIFGVKPEEIRDTKVVIRIRKSKKDRQHSGHNKKVKNYLQKLKIEQRELHYNTRVNRDALERLTVPAPLVTLVMLLSNDTTLV